MTPNTSPPHHSPELDGAVGHLVLVGGDGSSGGAAREVHAQPGLPAAHG